MKNDSIDNKMIGFIKQEFRSDADKYTFLEVYFRVYDGILSKFKREDFLKSEGKDLLCYAKQKAYMLVVDKIRDEKEEALERQRQINIYGTGYTDLTKRTR